MLRDIVKKQSLLQVGIATFACQTKSAPSTTDEIKNVFNLQEIVTMPTSGATYSTHTWEILMLEQDTFEVTPSFVFLTILLMRFVPDLLFDNQ